MGHFFPDDKTMHAAHHFPWAEGQVARDEMFGREVEKKICRVSIRESGPQIQSSISFPHGCGSGVCNLDSTSLNLVPVSKEESEILKRNR